MTTVALDASALMAPVERDLRLFDELDRLLGAVDPVVPGAVLEELDQRVDDNCSFHLSLDKQAAYQGDCRRGSGLQLRAKVEAYPAERPAAISNARVALAGGE